MEWQRALESPTAFLAEQARAADLVVFKRRKIQSDYFHYLDSDEAILRMDPTLSVPEGVTKLSADRVVVGWKDTREARRAVRDALPFLIRASKVTIAEICASDEQDVAARAMSRATLNGTGQLPVRGSRPHRGARRRVPHQAGEDRRRRSYRYGWLCAQSTG